jgi:hypothetical protein
LPRRRGIRRRTFPSIALLSNIGDGVAKSRPRGNYTDERLWRGREWGLGFKFFVVSDLYGPRYMILHTVS